MTPILVWLLIGSFYTALPTAIFGFLNFVGRILYTVGYAKSANNRLIGALLVDIAFFGLFICSLVTIGKIGSA